MKPIAWTRFAAEALALYAPPLGPRATWWKVKQTLEELAAAGCRSTRDLDPPHVARWLVAHQDRRPASNASILRTARALASYAVMRGYLESNPFDWKSPEKWTRLDREEPEPFDRHLSPQALRRVLDQADRGATDWPGRRLRALAYLLAYTGARRMEVLGLLVADVDQAAGLLEIRTNPRRPLKTRRSAALLAMPATLAAVLAGWIPEAGSVWLVPNVTRSGPWFGGRPGHRPYDQLRDLGRRAGVEGLCFDSFRDTLATSAESLGLGELELQRQLRHTTTRTQRHYRKREVANLRGIAAKLDGLKELPA
jgi:integrase